MEEKAVPKGILINKYKESMLHILERIMPNLSRMELIQAIDLSVEKSYKENKLRVNNNYTKREIITDYLSLANDLINDKAIMTTEGVLFCKHGTVKNPFYNLIQYLVDKRDEAKKEMKKHPKGSEEFNAWNLKQTNYKVSCNALYGCAGQYSSIFYNLYLCTAVTGQGRGCISASITMFESFLGNNVKFSSLTEALQFIENIVEDQKNPKFYRFKDWDILDRNITIEECFLRIIKNCGGDGWIPSNEARDAIWKTICNLDQRCINVLYYKNNLYKFCENRKIINLILTILVKLEKPFLDPNKIPKESEEELVLLKDIMFEYVYYRHMYIDKLHRVYDMQRDVVLITDTDSCIISLDEWYRFVLKYTIGIPMKVKYTSAQLEEEGDKLIKQYQENQPKYDYDFYNDKLVEAKRKKYPLIVIEEDSLRYSIVDIMSYIVSQLILDYMVLFSENYNTKASNRDCLLIMKNEFLFKCLLLTKGKKNYADLQLVQEGNIVPENKQLDIKGLPMTKVGIPETTSNRLKKILEFDILRNSFIDQVDIIKKFAILEKEIYESLKSKDKSFHKPARIKSMYAYKKPMSIQGIKASVAYNEIKDKEEENIDLEGRNSILIIKTNITSKNADLIAESHPNHYLRLIELLKDENFKGEVSSIAIPSDVEIPDWIVPFIDYISIIQDNLRSFPLEEIGISKLDSKNITYTNIIQF